MLLGSCAPDTVVGFGLKLSEGTVLGARKTVPPIRQPYFDLPLFRLGLSRPGTSDSPVIDVTDGPDVAEFGDTADLLFNTSYTVSGRSNHIGLRLGGTLPERQSTAEVLSRGVPVGAIEVPSREELLVLHRGRGVTAGYPVLAVVTSRSLDVLAQARPGDTIRFRKVTVAEATAGHRAAMRELEALRTSVNTVFGLLGVGAPASWRELKPASGS
jgi:allophanate hydrolase subunit 2